MNYPQRNTATFRFKHGVLLAFMLLQVGCFDSLSSSSGACASDDDCLGAQTCNDTRCVVSCFDTSDCPANETCTFNRCEPAPVVYEDASNTTSQPGPINNLDSGLMPPSDVSVDASTLSADQALMDMSGIEDMQTSDGDAAAPLDAATPLDAAAPLDVSPNTDADLTSDEQDVAPADAA